MSFLRLVYKNYFFSSMFVFMTTIMLAFVTTTPKQAMDKVISKLTQVKENYQRLDVITEKGDFVEELRVKLLRIPGVEKVSLISNENIQKKMGNLDSNLGIDVSKLSQNFIFAGITVQFGESFPQKSIILIQDYIKKLAGNKKLVMKLNRAPQKYDNLLNRLTVNLHFYVILLLFSMWFIGYNFWKSNTANLQYLIGRLHRNQAAFWRVNVATVVVPYLSGAVLALALFRDFELQYLASICLFIVGTLIYAMRQKHHWKN